MNARPLPWRKTKDPYSIWVSEVMLQQTQVATVIPFYRRFLRAFPTLASLAQAPLERVLEIWSGMGYYRRAQHLHLAAQAIVRNFAGRFPRNYDQVRSLPGVGDYTARAVLSIAFNLPYAALDGNVARVLGRLRALQGNLSQPFFRLTIEQDLRCLLSRRQPGDFNQALMELGQTICLPRSPRCPACPLRRCCRGYQQGTPRAYPTPRPRRAAEFRHLAAGIIRRKPSSDRRTGRLTKAAVSPNRLEVLLTPGLDEGLLSNLWNFPAASGRSRAGALARLRTKLAAIVRGSVHLGKPFAQLRHTITYRSLRVHLYPVELCGEPSQDSLRWFATHRLHRSAVSQLARKIATQL